MSVSDLAQRSGGRFQPSVLTAYERGDRQISIPRLCELADVYGVPPDRLLGEALDDLDPNRRAEAVIDLTRLATVEGQDLLPVAQFIHEIRTKRGDFLSDVITLRSGDLETLSAATELSIGELVRRLSPAIRLVLPEAKAAPRKQRRGPAG